MATFTLDGPGQRLQGGLSALLGRAPRIGRSQHRSDQPGQGPVEARGGAPRCASADNARAPRTPSP